jgi:hypothetical protein
MILSPYDFYTLTLKPELWDPDRRLYQIKTNLAEFKKWNFYLMLLSTSLLV